MGLSGPKQGEKLVWRASKDALLVKEALVRKKVLPDPVYDHYKQVPEDAIHALWLCPGVSIV